MRLNILPRSRKRDKEIKIFHKLPLSKSAKKLEKLNQNLAKNGGKQQQKNPAVSGAVSHSTGSSKKTAATASSRSSERGGGNGGAIERGYGSWETWDELEADLARRMSSADATYPRQAAGVAAAEPKGSSPQQHRGHLEKCGSNSPRGVADEFRCRTIGPPFTVRQRIWLQVAKHAIADAERDRPADETEREEPDLTAASAADEDGSWRDEDQYGDYSVFSDPALSQVGSFEGQNYYDYRRGRHREISEITSVATEYTDNEPRSLRDLVSVDESLVSVSSFEVLINWITCNEDIYGNHDADGFPRRRHRRRSSQADSIVPRGLDIGNCSSLISDCPCPPSPPLPTEAAASKGTTATKSVGVNIAAAKAALMAQQDSRRQQASLLHDYSI